MASIYRKRNSPCWFIQFIDTAGVRRNKSTGFRRDDPGQTLKARALRAQMEGKKLCRTDRAVVEGAWDAWVPAVE